MARSDVRIDYDTNDLLIEKSDSNVFDVSKHRYDATIDAVILTIIIPASQKNEEDWKKYPAHVDNIDEIDSSYDDRSLIVDYAYIDGNELEVFLGRFDSIGFVETSSPSFLTVGSFKKIIADNAAENKSTRIKYFYSEKNFNEILITYDNPDRVGFHINFKDYVEGNGSYTIDYGDGTVNVVTAGTYQYYTYTGGETSVVARVYDVDMRTVEGIFMVGISGSVTTAASSVSLSPNLTSLRTLEIRSATFETLDIPDTLTSLYEIDVSGSTELKQINIPPNADYIGNIRMTGCVSMKEFDINPKWQLWYLEFTNTSLTSAMINELLYMCKVSIYTDYAWFGTQGSPVENIFIDGDKGTFEAEANGFTLLNNGGSYLGEIGTFFTQDSSRARTGVESAFFRTYAPYMLITPVTKGIFPIFKNDTALSVVEGLDYEFSAFISVPSGIVGSAPHLDNGTIIALPSGYEYEECVVSGFYITEGNLYTVDPPTFNQWLEITTKFTAKATGDLTFSICEKLKENIEDVGGSNFSANIDDITFGRSAAFNPPDHSSGGFDGIQAYNNILEQNATNEPIDLDKTISIVENGDPYSVPVVPPTEDYDDRIPAVPVPTPPIPTGISDSSVTSAVTVSSVKLGDFVAEEAVEQNEYILMNINEGEFLKSPISGVGIKNYLQSPSGGQEMVDAITSKFSLDNLRVMKLDINETTIAIKSEPIEK